MSQVNTRRPFRILEERAPEEAQVWRVKSRDGQLRGPLSLTGIRSLVEVGLADHRASIAKVGEEHWMLLGAHPLWLQLKPAKPEFALRDTGSLPPIPEAMGASPMAPVLPETRARLAAVRQAEQLEGARWISLSRARNFLLATREVLALLIFATVGDVLILICNDGIGGGTSVVSFGLLAFAAFYYAVRIITWR